MATTKATRKTTVQQAPAVTELREPVQAAKPKIADRIAKGQALLAQQIGSKDDLAVAEKAYKIWDDYNREFLTHLFTTDKYAKEYSVWTGAVISMGGYRTLNSDIVDHLDTLRTRISRLESLSERLELIPLASSAVAVQAAPVGTQASPTDLSRVFIVHGHNLALQQSVARCVERLGLEAVILNEQANGGMTIIEKLEANADVGFAIVLLTADDMGRAATEPELKPRARQNVVLELGYFLAKLSRSNVCALHESGVEIPSDFMGVVYVPLDSGEAWKYRVAKELKAVGYEIDMNRI